MKVLVCGSRFLEDRKPLFAVLDKIHDETPITCIVCGAQRRRGPRGEYIGSDWFGIEWALRREVPFSGVPAEWTKFDKKAGPLRNSKMLAMHPDIDLVVATPGGDGTEDMVKKATAKLIPIKYVESEGK